MRKEAKHLYQKAIDSLTLSIELFNRPNDCGRIHGVLIFMDHSFEMLLKASIIHKGGKIKEKGAIQIDNSSEKNHKYMFLSTKKMNMYDTIYIKTQNTDIVSNDIILFIYLVLVVYHY